MLTAGKRVIIAIMKLGKTELGTDLTRNELGEGDGPVQARVEIVPGKDTHRIFLFPDDQMGTSRGLTILPSVRLVLCSEELVGKVEREELTFGDIAASMWPHDDEAVRAFRPEEGLVPVHPAVEGLDRPLSLLRGTFVELPPEQA